MAFVFVLLGLAGAGAQGIRPGAVEALAAASASNSQGEEEVPATAEIAPASPIVGQQLAPETEALPPSTTVIPPRVLFESLPAAPASAPVPASQSATAPADAVQPSQPVSANAPWRSEFGAPPVGGLADFLNEARGYSVLGLRLRESSRRLSSGEVVSGLVIVAVRKNSPADAAGLKAATDTVRSIMTGVAIAGAMVFPPAFVMLPLVQASHIGVHYEMVIGVDGDRVNDIIDFNEHMRYLKPGDTVYLNVVRDGERLQVPVVLPAAAVSLANGGAMH